MTTTAFLPAPASRVRDDVQTADRFFGIVAPARSTRTRSSRYSASRRSDTRRPELCRERIVDGLEVPPRPLGLHAGDMQCALAGVADGDRLLSRGTVHLAEVRRTADGELSARRISRHRHALRTCRVVAYEAMTSNRRYPSGRLAGDRLPGAPTVCRRAVRSRRRRRSPWPSSRTGRRWPGRRGAHGCGPRPVAPRGAHRLSSGIAGRLRAEKPGGHQAPELG